MASGERSGSGAGRHGSEWDGANPPLHRCESTRLVARFHHRMSADPPSHGEVIPAATMTVVDTRWLTVPQINPARDSRWRVVLSVEGRGPGQVDQLDEQRIELISKRRVFPEPTRSSGSARQEVALHVARNLLGTDSLKRLGRACG
jgi:hypothetical protein